MGLMPASEGVLLAVVADVLVIAEASNISMRLSVICA
jgi:hypothetical protein